jgi:hypothetical protein
MLLSNRYERSKLNNYQSKLNNYQRRLTLSLAYLAILRISAIFTTFVAASSKSSVIHILNPESEIIYLARSMLVPFILKTIGFFIPSALTPLINPSAMMSALNIIIKLPCNTGKNIDQN